MCSGSPLFFRQGPGIGIYLFYYPFLYRCGLHLLTDGLTALIRFSAGLALLRFYSPGPLFGGLALLRFSARVRFSAALRFSGFTARFRFSAALCFSGFAEAFSRSAGLRLSAFSRFSAFAFADFVLPILLAPPFFRTEKPKVPSFFPRER